MFNKGLPRLLLLLGFTLAACVATPPHSSLTGRWSAPSLSRPNVPILIELSPDGVAKEKIGTYSGSGLWKMEGSSAVIEWDSGWIGRLSPATTGTYHLETWKKGTPLDQPPDDRQIAQSE